MSPPRWKAEWRLMRWLALFTVLLPVVGPLIDHHYAQQDPYHGHIYLGGIVADHEHTTPARRHRHGDTTGEQSSTISVPAGNAAAAQRGLQTAQASFSLLLALPLMLFAAGTGRFVRLKPGAPLPCEEPCLPPPEKPPSR